MSHATVVLMAEQVHGGYGAYSGKASSASGALHLPWDVELLHASGAGLEGRALHRVRARNWRHAFYLLNAWVAERVSPEPSEVARG